MSRDQKPPGTKDKTARRDQPAGSFSSWLRRTRGALVKGDGVEVPCGGCITCCRSSYFIHIRPEENRTLARINKKLLSPAPGLPKGNVLLGYFEDGRCPMLIEDKCSIYEDRPLTCRSYDCRIFAAAGIDTAEDLQAKVAQRARRWRFDYPTERDREQHAAVKQAAEFLREHGEYLPEGVVPKNPVQLAVLAIQVYGVFLKRGGPGQTRRVLTDTETARAVMKAIERFRARIVNR